MTYKHISSQTFQRLPAYLNYLKMIQANGVVNVSAPVIANAIGLNEVVVRKDLAAVSTNGKPKIGYVVADLMTDIEHFLGYGNVNSAVIVGAGNLGRALMSYDGFKSYGLDIVAAFDNNENIVGKSVGGKMILPIEKLGEICRRLKIKIGIIAVPASEAQKICRLLVEGGITAILNFAPAHLDVPEEVLVRNEDMAYSLAVLSKHIENRYEDNEKIG